MNERGSAGLRALPERASRHDVRRVNKRTRSYASGTATKPLVGETIGLHFDKAVARWAARDALIVRHQNVRWSYAELKARVDAFAAGLIALGLCPGDRVGIWSANNAEWLITQYATAKAGLIQVNINPAYRSGELEYAINKVGCKALIVAQEFKTSNYLAMLEELVPELALCKLGELTSKRLPTLRILISIGSTPVPGYYSFEHVGSLGCNSDYERLKELEFLLQFDDPVNIQFTSGTTGSPKGATLSHHNILNNAFLVGENMQVGANDRLCIPVPLYHCFGMVMASLCSIVHGMAMVLPGAMFDAKSTLEAIQAEKCTVLYGVPTMFVAMLAEPAFSSFDLKSLRTGIVAGAPCPIDLMRRIVAAMNIRDVTIAYGMTETSPVSTQTSLCDSVERRVTTIGTVLPHTEVKIIDSDGRIVPTGVAGELCSRGYMVMLGYWGDEPKTRAAIDPAGWMHTGDLATMDEQGYCNIVGRATDMVIRGGENIYPREVEEFLYRHPQIENVQVFGVPDEKFGEELCAWIKVRSGETLTEDQVRAYCHGQIAYIKIPRYVRFVAEFPTTATGKFQKFRMRQAMMEELNLVVQETA